MGPLSPSLQPRCPEPSGLTESQVEGIGISLSAKASVSLTLYPALRPVSPALP